MRREARVAELARRRACRPWRRGHRDRPLQALDDEEVAAPVVVDEARGPVAEGRIDLRDARSGGSVMCESAEMIGGRMRP
jgi:hypothetical protein